MLGYAITVKGLLETVLRLQRRSSSAGASGRGQLDHTLIQPQPLWLALLTEGFMPFSGSAGAPARRRADGLGRAAPGAGGHGRAGWRCWCSTCWPRRRSCWRSTYLWGSLAFWAPRAAEEISSSALRLIYQLKPFPLDGLGPVLTGGC